MRKRIFAILCVSILCFAGAWNSEFWSRSGNTLSTASSVTAVALPAIGEAVTAHGTTSGAVTLIGGKINTITLDGNATFTVTEPGSSGWSMPLKITNGGAHTITWSFVDNWAGGAAPTLTTSGTDWLVFVSDGSAVDGAMSMEDVQ